MSLKADFEERRNTEIAGIEAVLAKYLPREEGYAKTVAEAVNYSILAGGKRLRPMLMQEAFRLFGGKGERIEPFMAAMEMIHNYSLVHDDLPCMDNDEYRRGRKTTHTVYGEGMAVLAGDSLLNLAFETAAKAFELPEVQGDVPKLTACARALSILAGKAGINGMIGGQCADTQAEEYPAEMVTQDLLLYIHENKTAALIESSLMIGAVLAGADELSVKALEQIGSRIGLAFQIQDDILDLTSSLEVLGKQTGSDLRNNKVTYVSLNGMEHSVHQVAELSAQALRGLSELGEKSGYRNEFLENIVEDLITRKK